MFCIDFIISTNCVWSVIMVNLFLSGVKSQSLICGCSLEILWVFSFQLDFLMLKDIFLVGILFWTCVNPALNNRTLCLASCNNCLLIVLIYFIAETTLKTEETPFVPRIDWGELRANRLANQAMKWEGTCIQSLELENLVWRCQILICLKCKIMLTCFCRSDVPIM